MKISLNCWQHVCLFAGAEELMALSETSRAIKALTDKQELWERLVVRSVRTDLFVRLPIAFVEQQWKCAMVALLKSGTCLRTNDSTVMAQWVRGESGDELVSFRRPPLTVFVSGRHKWDRYVEIGHENLVLQGVEGASISGSHGLLFVCFVNGVVFRGLHFEKLPSARRIDQELIQVDETASLAVEQCTFKAPVDEPRGRAISLGEALYMEEEGDGHIIRPSLLTRLVLTDCLFEGFSDRAVLSTQHQAPNMHGGCSARLLRCQFKNCGMGIHQDAPGDWSLIECSFEGISDRAVSFSSMQSVTIRQCRVENARRGSSGAIFCYDTPLVEITDTVIAKCGAAGIYTTNVGTLTILRTSVSDCNEGLFFVGQMETEYEGNGDDEPDGGEEEDDVELPQAMLQQDDEHEEEEEEEEEEEQVEEGNGEAQEGEEGAGGVQQMDIDVGDVVEVELPVPRFIDLPPMSRTDALKLVCEDVHIKNGYVNVQAHAACVFRNCSFAASSIGLKAESSFVGRVDLRLEQVTFDRAGLLLSGGCDAHISNVQVASGRVTAVSGCTLECEGLTGTILLLRRLNGQKDVARLDLRGHNSVQILEEPESHPAIRKDECASVDAFCEAFQRESRKIKCCTRVFTGINHFRQPMWECYTCPNTPALCWFCLPEHQALLHNTTTAPSDDSGFCDCDCTQMAKKR